jgi:serine/threonine protein kinase
MKHTVVKELGEGSFGKVYLVKFDGKFYAKKEIEDSIDILIGVKEMNVTRVASELSPEVVKIHDHHMSSKEGRYVMDQFLEYCKDGSLEEVLDQEGEFPDRGVLGGGVNERIDNLSNIVVSLATLHSHGIFHMDIKTDNILYKDAKMRLCDFSNCIINTPWKVDYQPPKNQYQSLIYRSPDIATLKVNWESAERSDVWAFGILILEAMGLAEDIRRLESEADDKMQYFKNIINRYVTAESRGKSKGICSHEIYANIFPKGLRGWDLVKDTSTSYGYIWCSIFSGLIKNIDFEAFFQKSLDYFKLRRYDMSEPERERLRTLITSIVPKMLVTRSSSRISMKEVAGLMGRDVPETHLQTTPAENNYGEIWDEFEKQLSKVRVTYGTEIIDVPPQVISYARAIAETHISSMYIKKRTDQKSFYQKVFGASFLISCEMFDLMIELVDDEYIVKNEMKLTDIETQLVDITNSTAGKLIGIWPRS